MQRDRLEVAAVGLADRHGAGEPSGVTQVGDRARERERQRTAVGHDVRNPRGRPIGADAREHRRQRRVEIGDHDRHPAEIVGVPEHRVGRRVLLVDAEHGHLLRCIARLHQVTGSVRVWRQPAGHHDDHGVAAGPEPEGERSGVHEDLVAYLGNADEVDDRPAP